MVALLGGDHSPFYLQGVLDQYPVLPPLWTFTAEDGTGGGNPHFFPKTEGTSPPAGSWLFILHENQGVICAPFNRLSYGPKGPHKDWGDASHWRNVEPSRAQAHDVGSMLAVIDRDLQYTKGRMA